MQRVSLKVFTRFSCPKSLHVQPVLLHESRQPVILKRHGAASQQACKGGPHGERV